MCRLYTSSLKRLSNKFLPKGDLLGAVEQQEEVSLLN
jgi:hypothetical protein